MDNTSLNYWAFLWHAVFLSITVTFTEINSIIPALILQVGGREIHVGIVTAIMIGVPLIAQLNFAGFLHGKQRKKPYLLLGIHLRVVSLLLIALTIISIGRLSTVQALLLIYGELVLFTVSGAFAGLAYVDLTGKSFGSEMRKRFFTRKQLLASMGILGSAFLTRHLLHVVPYPTSYFLLFVAAAVVLLVAAGGFWMVRETPGTGGQGLSYLQTLRAIPGVLREDANLRRYLLYANAIGFHVALTPFYVSLAKHRYFLDPALAGNLLFFQIIGMVSASFIWPALVRRGGFKRVLRVWSVISAALPVVALVVSWTCPLPVFVALFFFTGAATSARKVCEDAVIVELTAEHNRVLYTGIAGTLNISMAIAPIFLGALIGAVGYTIVFAAVALTAVGSFLMLNRLVCPIDIERLQKEHRIG